LIQFHLSEPIDFHGFAREDKLRFVRESIEAYGIAFEDLDPAAQVSVAAFATEAARDAEFDRIRGDKPATESNAKRGPHTPSVGQTSMTLRMQKDMAAAVGLVAFVEMTPEGRAPQDEVTAVAAVFGWTAARAQAAVQDAQAQAHLMPTQAVPTDADLAEMLLTIAGRGGFELSMERTLSSLRRWPIKRARRALAEAARLGLVEFSAVSEGQA
jgi:hypothetical protein